MGFVRRTLDPENYSQVSKLLKNNDDSEYLPHFNVIATLKCINTLILPTNIISQK